MVKLVLIKTADSLRETIGDVVGFWEGTHEFNDLEKQIFEIITIEGYTRVQIVEFARNKRPQTREVFQSKAPTGRWTFDKQVEKDAWLDGDTWRFIEENPKHKYTCRNMTKIEKDILSSELSSPFDKLNALAHLETTYNMISANQTEIPDVAKEVIVSK